MIGRLAAALALALVATSCAAADGSSATTSDVLGADELAVVVASFDLAVGDDERLLLGVFTPDRQVVGGGEVELTLTAPDGRTVPDEGAMITAGFLPVPGTGTPDDLAESVLLGRPASHDHAAGEATAPHDHGDPDAAGVYTTDLVLDQAGLWEVTVNADVEGTRRTGSTVFEVAETHQVPMAGEPAPRVATATLDSDLPATAIDSRAGMMQGEIPDEALHRTDLADALAAGRPAVVVFSTPTYCTSRFCGPITETIEELAAIHDDAVVFVHVEIWRDIATQRMNAAVAPWIVTDDGGNEPWVFAIGADGTIAARWDNVLDVVELTTVLDRLAED